MNVFRKFFVVVALIWGTGFSMNAQVQGDCDCTDAELEEIVCIDFGQGFILPISICEYNCMSEMDETFNFSIVDCPDDIDLGDDWGDDWNPNDSIPPSDCDCTGEEELILCVDLGQNFIIPMSQCEYECFAANDDFISVVDCGDIDFGDDWGDDWNPNDSIPPSDCECTGEEELIVCVDLGQNFIIPMSQCEYECFAVNDDFATIVDCGDIDFGDDWGDDWTPNDSIPDFECDCTGEEELIVCVDLGQNFIIPMSQCEFDCYYANDDFILVVDCDDFDFGDDWGDDWNPNDSIPDFECDCTGEEELIVCVDLGQNFIIPMSQCEYECFATNDDYITVVDCDDIDFGDDWDNDWNPNDSIPFDCDSIPAFDCECIGDEVTDICVDFGQGFIAPMSQCEYDCLVALIPELTIVTCEDGGENSPIGEELGIMSQIEDLQIYPNPVGTGSISLQLYSSVGNYAGVEIYNLFGQVVYKEQIELNDGSNTIKINVNSLEKGMYTLSVKAADNKTITERLIKN